MEQKLIVITGASSGFGREMAKLFAADGHNLLLLARRTEMLEQVKAECGGENIMTATVDVTDYLAVETAITEAVAKFGPVDLLVNNAGVMLLGDPMSQSTAEWKQMLDVNVLGVLNATQIVLPSMRERKGGTIINVSSLAGVKAFANHAAYCASKFGVHGLTDVIRQESAMDCVRVATVSPGAAETELLSHTTSDEIISGYNEWKETMGGTSMDPVCVAQSVKFIYDMPQAVNIRELQIAPTMQVD